MAQEDELIPIAIAAERLGVLPIAIRQAIRRGRFSAVKRGRDWYTTEQDIQDYKQQRAQSKGGRPRGS